VEWAYAHGRNTVSSVTSWAIVIHMIQNHWTVTLFYVLPHSLSSADKTTEPPVPCGFHVTEVFYFERLTWFSGIKEGLCSGSEFLPRAEKTKPPFNWGFPSCTVSWNILTILCLKSFSNLFLLRMYLNSQKLLLVCFHSVSHRGLICTASFCGNSIYWI